MNSSSQSSSPSAQSSSPLEWSLLYSEAVRARNRADMLITEVRFLAQMMKKDGVAHGNNQQIIDKTNAHMDVRWAEMEAQEKRLASLIGNKL